MGDNAQSESVRLGLQTTECWRCGEQRYIYESCHHCGGSCKPLKKRKQRKRDMDTGHFEANNE